MDSKRVKAFRPAARTGVIASSLALVALLISSNAAVADASIGAPAGDPITAFCTLSVDAVQASTDSTTSYAVPFDGFITSWSSQTGLGVSGRVGLEVWHFVSSADPVTSTPAVYQLVVATGTVPQTGASNTLAAPGLAVHKGDLLGMRMEGFVACGNQTLAPLDFYVQAATATPLPGANESFPLVSAGRLNISATVTPAITPPPPPPPPPPTGCDSSSSTNASDECDQNNNDQTDKEKADTENDHHDNPAPDQASSAQTNERKDS